MVDIDDLRDDSGSSSSKSKSSKSGDSSSSSGSDGIGEESGTYTLDDDDMVDPSDKVVGKTSKKWAEDKGELNDDARPGESFSDYANRQVKEVEELHENIREMANKNMDNFDEFTLYFHALFLNFAQNRVGIMETIENQFGKDREEAKKLTYKICEDAGETEFMKQMLDDITENIADI